MHKGTVQIWLQKLFWLTCENCANEMWKKRKEKGKKNIWCFNYLKIPDAISCNRGSRWITPQEVGVSLCLRLPRLFTRCVNMIAFLRLSKESCAYKLIIQPSFFPADLMGYLLEYLKPTVVTQAALLQVLSLFLKCETCGKNYCTEKRLRAMSSGNAGSDRWYAVADLHVEFVRCLEQRRLLQHVVLHDHLLVSIDWGVCVVRVVPWLVSARLIGWLWGQGFFTFAAQELTAERNQEGDLRLEFDWQLQQVKECMVVRVVVGSM